MKPKIVKISKSYQFGVTLLSLLTVLITMALMKTFSDVSSFAVIFTLIMAFSICLVVLILGLKQHIELHSDYIALNFINSKCKYEFKVPPQLVKDKKNWVLTFEKGDTRILFVKAFPVLQKELNEYYSNHT